jgi:hypothetical protein
MVNSPKLLTLAFAVSACLFAVDVPASAQQKTTVKFASGSDTGAVDGTVTGSQYHDYLLGAKAAQKLSVSLITEGDAFFNILPPGSDSIAIYNSSESGNDAVNILLPNDGNYTVRVYLMGDAKDTGKTAKYTVSTTIMD